MKTAVRVEGEITPEGRLLVELPPTLPSGPVAVTLEPLSENLELTEEDLRGAGLTAEEIASSPEVGAWAEDPQIRSGAEYVEAIRRGPARYSW